MPVSMKAKDYTKTRIRQIAEKAVKQIQPLAEPCLNEFINAAVLEGTAKLKPSKNVIAAIYQIKMKCRGYRESDIDIKEIIVEPQAYKDAVKAFKDSEKATESRRVKLFEYADQIIDQLMLDEFESGQQAIDAMNKFASEI